MNVFTEEHRLIQFVSSFCGLLALVNAKVSPSMYSAQGFAGRGGFGGGAGAAAGTAAPRGGAGSNFSNSTQSGGGSSPGGTSGGSKRQVQPLRPMSIKQLVSATRVGDGVMVIDGREATQTTVVGRIIEYEGNASGAMTAKHHGYRISDGSGSLIVRQWLDAEKSQELLPVGSFVRASGSVKVWQERPIITGTVRLISDCNEMTFHMLDVVLTHLRITRGPIPHSASLTRPAAAAAAAAGGAAANTNFGGQEKLYATDVVVSILKTHAKTDLTGGLSIEEIAKQASRFDFGINEVRTAMKSLIAEGKIFTVDGNRYSA